MRQRKKNPCFHNAKAELRKLFSENKSDLATSANCNRIQPEEPRYRAEIENLKAISSNEGCLRVKI